MPELIIKKENSYQHEIHLPDLEFSKYIIKRFGINKGIYNTIDTWLWKQGIYKIDSRRLIVITFLNECTLDLKKQTRKIKFGAGGLVSKLEEFLKKISNYHASQISN